MVVMLQNGCLAVVPLTLRLDEFEGLLCRFREQNPRTADIEREAQELIRRDFPQQESEAFVQAVCRWGGGQRLLNRIAEQNTLEQISEALRDGQQAAQRGDVAKGLEHIARLTGLGQSFASKHLRFLEPDRAVVLDGNLRARLGYGDRGGYARFLSDCHTILSHVNKAAVPPGLRICDVEAAIFMKVKDLGD